GEADPQGRRDRRRAPAALGDPGRVRAYGRPPRLADRSPAAPAAAHQGPQERPEAHRLPALRDGRGTAGGHRLQRGQRHAPGLGSQPGSRARRRDPGRHAALAGARSLHEGRGAAADLAQGGIGVAVLSRLPGAHTPPNSRHPFGTEDSWSSCPIDTTPPLTSWTPTWKPAAPARWRSAPRTATTPTARSPRPPTAGATRCASWASRWRTASSWRFWTAPTSQAPSSAPSSWARCRSRSTPISSPTTTPTSSTTREPRWRWSAR